MLVRDEREDQRGRVERDQHPGDGAAHDLAPDERLRPRGQNEERRHQQPDHREHERGGVHRRGALAVGLLLVPEPADEEGDPQDEQQVPEDGAGERCLHDVELPVHDEKDGDHELRDVAERRVEEPADPRSRVQGELVGRPSDQPGERHDRDRGSGEYHQIAVGEQRRRD